MAPPRALNAADVRTPAEAAFTGDLKRQNDILKSVLESMGDGVVVVDQNGEFLLFNAAARRIYGRGPVAVESDRWTEVYGALQADGVTPFPADELPLARALRGESTDQVELFFRNAAHPAGIWVASTGRPLLDATGHVRGGIVVLRDITLHRQAESELRNTNHRLTELVTEKAGLLSQSRAVAEMSSFLQACETTDELYAVIGDYFQRFVAHVAGAFYVYSPSRDDLEPAVRWGAFRDEQLVVIKPTDCWSLRRGRIHHGAAKTGLRCAHRIAGEGTYLCVPVLGAQETIGLLHLAVPEMASRVDGSSVLEHTVLTASEYIGMALANVRLRTALRHQSIRDPLTGLFNRRFLEETLSQAIHRAERNGRCVSVLMLDIDRFKQFNDSHGHPAGDDMLRQFGAMLLEDSRGGDIAARYGGEEFTLVLPDTSLSAARERAERVVAKTKRLRPGDTTTPYPVISVSVGIASYPDHGTVPVELLTAADAALYGAKQQGRDRVVVATQERSPRAPAAVQ